MRSLLCPRLSPFCSALACLQIWRGWHHLPLPLPLVAVLTLFSLCALAARTGLCLALTLGYLLGPCCWGPGWLASASLPVSLGGCGLAGWHCVLDHTLEVLMAERLLLLCPRPRARRGPSVLVAALPSHWRFGLLAIYVGLVWVVFWNSHPHWAGWGRGHPYRVGSPGLIFLFVWGGPGRGPSLTGWLARPYLPFRPGQAGAGAIPDWLACRAVLSSSLGAGWGRGHP